MNPSSWLGSAGEHGDVLEVLAQESDSLFCRMSRCDGDGDRQTFIAAFGAAEHPTRGISRLTHEYGLKEYLEPSWAVRPRELVEEEGRTLLVLEDPGGQFLTRRLGRPMGVDGFLRLAIAITAAVKGVHQRGLVHKDIKPANILVLRDDEVRITGFGIASRAPRERQFPDEPPEFIAGTLAYMAPEQTGRMNRSIDSRSDLYALGMTFYEMLGGSGPFTPADAVEWIHCHIARQPASLADRRPDVPPTIADIVMKLLAKAAEDRYQTAVGLEGDLRRCLADWETRDRIDAFSLGEYDIPSRLLIPEKLYGRERDIDTLLGAFDRIMANGGPELVLVSGYSGIGKSAVVNELHKVLVLPRGLFASGKFDQYKCDIPYASLAQAFQQLIRQLLGRSETDLRKWRDSLVEALGPDGLLIMGLVPELKFVIGEQRAVPPLPPQQAKARFHRVVRRFIAVFARPEHPLALFLDDLQWLDAATLDLIESLLTEPDVRHLLLIGAFRSNEVDASHRLTRRFMAIRESGARVSEIVLGPLAGEQLRQLIADGLRCHLETAVALAQLVQEKTGGNPFFSIQFLNALAEEGLLVFDHAGARWSWEIDRIHAKGYTDNVADLMVGKLNRLPLGTQNALKQLACLGNTARTRTLSIVLEIPEDKIHDELSEAVQQELVIPLTDAYKFVHDRVQEAAYSLIPEAERARVHLGIGRLLVAHRETEEEIFEIVSQFNRGASLIDSVEEREQVAEFNLRAGRRAKVSTAYVTALNLLSNGSALLREDCWVRRHELIFALELNRAECEFLTGALATAGARLEVLSAHAATTVERAAVACLRVDLYTTLGQIHRAVAVNLDYLRHLGVDWSPHPTDEEVKREYERIWSQLGDRMIEDVIDLPLMSDPASLSTLELLTRLVPAALFTDARLLSLVICRMVNLSLEHGNSDGSCFAYVWLGVITGPHFGNYRSGFRFGRIGHELIERRGLKRFEARTRMVFGNLVAPWIKHLRDARKLLRRAFDDATKCGDLTFAAYSCQALNRNLLAAGEPLVGVHSEAENGLEFARKARFGLVFDVITSQLAIIRTLRGMTSQFGCFDSAEFDEVRFERHLAGDVSLAAPECWYWIRKMQARFFAGDLVSALAASSKARQLLWTSPSHFESAEYHFFDALCLSTSAGSEPSDRRGSRLGAVLAHREQLEIWAEHCPENFESRAALVGAEIARIEGRELDAMRLYERAIQSARANGFVNNEALANELAARFYAGSGFETIANASLREARACYLRWGADGKVRHLEMLHPGLRNGDAARSGAARIAAPIEHIDFETIVKVSKAVSGEMVLEKLIDTLMRLAIEHAGAERGLLLLSRNGELRQDAEAITSGDAIVVQRREGEVAALPESVVHYVMRSREIVILDDASSDPMFSQDLYVRGRGAKSILCLPLVNGSKLTGVLYLENNLAAHAFAPDRTAILKLLALQAAISIENSYLYGDLAEREAKIRRLVEANIIGILIADFRGAISDTNDAFLQMIGYERHEVTSGGMRWDALTPVEWREIDLMALAQFDATGVIQPYEKELVKRDGSRVAVLVGAASFDGAQDQGVVFVLDLTHLKQAERAARESEGRYQKVRLELAHASRVATMGQLTASLAHEISHPIAVALIGAEAARRWLSREPPEVEQARETIDCIVRDGTRAANIIGRIRDLIKKAPARLDNLKINEAILEVVALTRSEMSKNGVLLYTELAGALPVIQGDRVQLQQVMLNLILNAVEAMREQRGGRQELLISTEAGEGGVLVAVRDSGPGLCAVGFDQIFETFYTTKPNGMGMGLSICRSIVEAHGGRLWASANVPTGAAFRFTVPVHGGGTG